MEFRKQRQRWEAVQVTNWHFKWMRSYGTNISVRMYGRKSWKTVKKSEGNGKFWSNFFKHSVFFRSLLFEQSLHHAEKCHASDLFYKELTSLDRIIKLAYNID